MPIIMCLSNKKRIKHIYKENGRTYEEIEVVDEREWNEEENGDNNDDDEYDEKKKKKQQNKDTSMYDEVMQELVEEEKEKAKTLLKEKYREKVREHLLNGTEEKLFEVETKNE
ncbi:MAG: hypothetical protein LBO09_05955 [Candidatus Peribacteria bacterium]|nr:hypothetical protein [Candidatus Peribacteria bacterium]